MSEIIDELLFAGGVLPDKFIPLEARLPAGVFALVYAALATLSQWAMQFICRRVATTRGLRGRCKGGQLSLEARLLYDNPFRWQLWNGINRKGVITKKYATRNRGWLAVVFFAVVLSYLATIGSILIALPKKVHVERRRDDLLSIGLSNASVRGQFGMLQFLQGQCHSEPLYISENMVSTTMVRICHHLTQSGPGISAMTPGTIGVTISHPNETFGPSVDIMTSELSERVEYRVDVSTLNKRVRLGAVWRIRKQDFLPVVARAVEKVTSTFSDPGTQIARKVLDNSVIFIYRGDGLHTHELASKRRRSTATVSSLRNNLTSILNHILVVGPPNVRGRPVTPVREKGQVNRENDEQLIETGHYFSGMLGLHLLGAITACLVALAVVTGAVLEPSPDPGRFVMEASGKVCSERLLAGEDVYRWAAFSGNTAGKAHFGYSIPAGMQLRELRAGDELG